MPADEQQEGRLGGNQGFNLKETESAAIAGYPRNLKFKHPAN